MFSVQVQHIATHPPPVVSVPFEHRYHCRWHGIEVHRTRWRRLLTLLPEPTPERVEALNHLLDQHWPDDLRELPDLHLDRGWWPIIRCVTSHSPPRAPLNAIPEATTHLVLDGGELGWREHPCKPSLPRVSHLVVEGDPEGLCVDLFAGITMPELQHVGFVSCSFGDSHMDALVAAVKAGRWRAPRALDLGQNPDLGPNRLTDRGLARLVASPAADRLKTLIISSDVGITDDGITCLAAAPRMRHLEQLDLHGGLGAAGVLALAFSAHLKSLKSLRAVINPDGVLPLEEVQDLLAHIDVLDLEEG